MTAPILSPDGKQFYVYILKRPDGTPFYVGKGKGRRVSAHVREARGNWKGSKQAHKLNVIRKILREGGQVQYEIESWHDTDSLACQREVELIASIGRTDIGTGPLTNKSTGGEGGINGPEGRAKIAASKKQWHAENRELSRSIQAMATAASCTDEWKVNQSAAQKKWIQENPELHKRRIAKTAAKLRTKAVRKRNSASKKRFFRLNPSAAKEHSEKLRQWAAAHPEHMKKMVERAATPEAIAKNKASVAKWREANPILVAVAEAKRLATCRTSEYRKKARARLEAYAASHPEEMAARHEKINAKKREASRLRRKCLDLVSEHSLNVELPDYRSGLSVWQSLYDSLVSMAKERANGTSVCAS